MKGFSASANDFPAASERSVASVTLLDFGHAVCKKAIARGIEKPTASNSLSKVNHFACSRSENRGGLSFRKVSCGLLTNFGRLLGVP